MKIGDYVRTEDGTITRIKMFYGKKWKNPELIYARFLCENYEIYEYPRQVKSSPNIIDLIEVGDYVNGTRVNFVYSPDGKQVFRIELDVDGLKGHMICESKHIKSIVTKEQFERMKYIVGE